MEAGDLEGAVEAVGCATVDNADGLIAAVTSKLQHSLLVQEQHMRTAELTLQGQTRVHRLADLNERISRLRHEIEAIRTRVRESDGLCPITMEEIQVPVTVPCCQNTFEYRALLRAMGERSSHPCPICRSPLRTHDLVVMHRASTNLPTNSTGAGSSGTDGSSGRGGPAQMLGGEQQPFRTVFCALEQCLRDIFASQPDAKVIVFSAHSMSKILR